MKTINFFKYLIILSLSVGAVFTSCDDDELGDAPRLFRPIPSLSNNANSITATWDLIKGSTSYELTLLKATGEVDVNGDDVYATYRTVTVTESSYTFESVDWDEKYKLLIKAIGNNIESLIYETDDLSIVYPTKISETRVVDNAVLAKWKVEGNPITFVQIIPEVPGDTITQDVTEAEYLNGQVIVEGLESNTAYRLIAYSGTEQNSDTYEGRIRFKTSVPEDYDTLFGAGKWLDLRASDDPDILATAPINDYEAIILRGGFEYNITSMVFSTSKTFLTGLTLSGNAVFVQSAGFQSGTNIDKLKFEKINFISDKAYAKPVREYTAKSFDGRQVYNVNNTNTIVNEMIFKDCRIEGYRAVIRLQSETDGVRNITFDGCTINGIGDQGVVTTNNKTAVMENITITNTTLLNIVMLCDLRSSASAPTLYMNGCTFCYAPIETTANANTPLMRFASNAAIVTVSNTIFGPSLATTNSAGDNLITYTAGTAGSIFLNGTAAAVSVTNSYKTNFSWATIGDAGVTYPIDALESLSLSEETLFQDPSQENFTITTNFSGAKTAGAEKWRMP